MPKKLENLVAIITGAGRNIGESTAHLLAEHGAAIAVVDLDREAAEKVAAALRETGATAQAFVCDVSKEDQVTGLVSDVTSALGRVDILVNNVAISDNKHILDITAEEWNATLGVTLTGTFLMGKHVAAAMVAQGEGGVIVNVGSTSGFYGRPRAVAYTAAKAGVANLSRSMAVMLAEHDIRVNCVVPNKIGSPVGKTEFNPDRKVVNLRNRPGVPDDMARAILFLVSPDSDFIAGHSLFVDGGVSAMMPGSQ